MCLVYAAVCMSMLLQEGLHLRLQLLQHAMRTVSGVQGCVITASCAWQRSGVAAWKSYL